MQTQVSGWYLAGGTLCLQWEPCQAVQMFIYCTAPACYRCHVFTVGLSLTPIISNSSWLEMFNCVRVLHWLSKFYEIWGLFLHFLESTNLQLALDPRISLLYTESVIICVLMLCCLHTFFVTGVALCVWFYGCMYSYFLLTYIFFLSFFLSFCEWEVGEVVELRVCMFNVQSV